MSALVTALLALALHRLWLPLQHELTANAAFLYGDPDAAVCGEQSVCAAKGSERSAALDTNSDVAAAVSKREPAVCGSGSKKQKQQQQQQQRSVRRKKQSPKALTAQPVEQANTKAEKSVRDFHSDASTCGSSDEEDAAEAEDLGERERKLMLARAQQIRTVTQQQKSRRAKTKAASPSKPEAPTPAPVPSCCELQQQDASYPDVCAPLRLRNVTNTLWHWSVFSGFEADRSPLDARYPDCGACEQSEQDWEGTSVSDELLRMLADDGLAP